MVTGCGCHDPQVFGHQAPCPAGPRPLRPGPVSWRDRAEERALDSRIAELREEELRAGKRGNAYALISMKYRVRRYR